MTNCPDPAPVPRPASGDTVAFIVRIWYEAVDTDGAVRTWRGSVERVASRERVFFADLDSVVAYIRREAGLNALILPGP